MVQRNLSRPGRLSANDDDFRTAALRNEKETDGGA
jgi:hypothetical protein